MTDYLDANVPIAFAVVNPPYLTTVGSYVKTPFCNGPCPK
jgi:hypothetical protein